jgi:hypothetical protein
MRTSAESREQVLYFERAIPRPSCRAKGETNAACGRGSERLIDHCTLQSRDREEAESTTDHFT